MITSHYLLDSSLSLLYHSALSTASSVSYAATMIVTPALASSASSNDGFFAATAVGANDIGGGDVTNFSTLSIYFKIVLGIMLVIVILVSIFGNLLVCVAISSDRRLRRLGNLFIVSLAIADLCVGALVMTFALANDLLDYWPFGPQLCEIWIAFDISCSTCSIINLCAIALDRFVYIKDPMRYNRWINKKIVIGCVTAIWLVSVSISFVPISLGWHKPNNQHEPIPFLSSGATFAAVRFPHLSRENNSIAENVGSGIDAKINSTLTNHSDITLPDESSPPPPPPPPLSMQSAIPHHAIRHPNRNSRNSDNNHPTTTTSSEIISNSAYHYHPHHQQQLQSQLLSLQSTERNSEEIRFLDAHSMLMSLGSTTEKSSANNEDDFILLPQCALDLTPTYAVVSSIISFYLPCIVMLYLYAKLYSICQQHVKCIKSMTKFQTPAHCGAPQTFVIGDDSSQIESKKLPLENQQESKKYNSKNDTNTNNKNDGKNRMRNSSINQPQINAVNRQQQQQSHASEHKAAITLGIIMGTFLACWMPFFCMNIIAAYCKKCSPLLVFKILTWLGYFNSSLNPVIYSIFNTEFRDAFRRILIRYFFNDETSAACSRLVRCKTPRSSTITVLAPTPNVSNNGNSSIQFHANDNDNNNNNNNNDDNNNHKSFSAKNSSVNSISSGGVDKLCIRPILENRFAVASTARSHVSTNAKNADEYTNNTETAAEDIEVEMIFQSRNILANSRFSPNKNRRIEDISPSTTSHDVVLSVAASTATEIAETEMLLPSPTTTTNNDVEVGCENHRYSISASNECKISQPILQLVGNLSSAAGHRPMLAYPQSVQAKQHQSLNNHLWDNKQYLTHSTDQSKHCTMLHRNESNSSGSLNTTFCACSSISEHNNNDNQYHHQHHHRNHQHHQNNKNYIPIITTSACTTLTNTLVNCNNLSSIKLTNNLSDTDNSKEIFQKFSGRQQKQPQLRKNNDEITQL